MAGLALAGGVADLASPHRLIVPALANAVVILGAYLSAAAAGVGACRRDHGSAAGPGSLRPAASGWQSWRVAHLSDLHVVGERYGFRIESGRAGPRGNERLTRVLAQLDALHVDQPLDVVLVTGDMTDAGRSAEWAEFLAALGKHPRLAERVLVLPGNHDVNVVDRANPARLDLPTKSRSAPAAAAYALSHRSCCRAPGFGSSIRRQCD